MKEVYTTTKVISVIFTLAGFVMILKGMFTDGLLSIIAGEVMSIPKRTE